MESKYRQKATSFQGHRFSITPTRTRSTIPQEVLNYLSKSPVPSHNNSFQAANESAHSSQRTSYPRSNGLEHSKSSQKIGNNRGETFYYNERKGSKQELEEINMYHRDVLNAKSAIREVNLDRSRKNWKIMKQNLSTSGENTEERSKSKSPNRVGNKYTESDIENLISTLSANKLSRNSRADNNRLPTYEESSPVRMQQAERLYQTFTPERELPNPPRMKIRDTVNMIREIGARGEIERSSSQERSQSPNFRGPLENNRSLAVLNRKQSYSIRSTSPLTKKNTSKTAENQMKGQNANQIVPIFKENLRDFMAANNSCGEDYKDKSGEAQRQKKNQVSMLELSRSHLKNKTSILALKYPDKSGISMGSSYAEIKAYNIQSEKETRDNGKSDMHEKHTASSLIFDNKDSLSSLNKIGSRSDKEMDFDTLAKLLKQDVSRITTNDSHSNLLMHRQNANSLTSLQGDIELCRDVADSLAQEIPQGPSPYTNLPLSFPNSSYPIVHNVSKTSLPSQHGDFGGYAGALPSISKPTLPISSKQSSRNTLDVELEDRPRSSGHNNLLSQTTLPKSQEVMSQKVHNFEEPEATPRYGCQEHVFEKLEDKVPVDESKMKLNRPEELRSRASISSEIPDDHLKVSQPDNSMESLKMNIERMLGKKELESNYSKTGESMLYETPCSQQEFNSFGDRRKQKSPSSNVQTIQKDDIYSLSSFEIKYLKEKAAKPSEAGVEKSGSVNDSLGTKVNQPAEKSEFQQQQQQLGYLGQYTNQKGYWSGKKESGKTQVKDKNAPKMDYYEVKIVYREDYKEAFLAQFFNEAMVIRELDQFTKELK